MHNYRATGSLSKVDTEGSSNVLSVILILDDLLCKKIKLILNISASHINA